ncbi:hypothetical protein BC628DRAFT_1315580 [Trametes gibbosa]|nr:hypothetical protein BC628DRAFT_1315580 [Trametes gibbosa]
MTRQWLQARHHLLNQHIVEGAHTLLLDDDFSDRVLRPCVRSLLRQYAYQCFRKIYKERVRHIGGNHDSQLTINITVSLALDVAEVALNNVRSTYAVLDLDDLAADLRALPYNMVSPPVSERLYRILVKVLQHGAGGKTCEYDVYSMLDCLTPTKWFMGSTSDIVCGEALERMCQSAPSTSSYSPGRDGHRELITFLGACYLRRGFSVAQDRASVRAHLESALCALHRHLTQPGWKCKWETWLLVVGFTPILVELHTHLPRSVARGLVVAMEDKVARLLADVDIRDAKVETRMSRHKLSNAIEQSRGLSTSIADYSAC